MWKLGLTTYEQIKKRKTLFKTGGIVAIYNGDQIKAVLEQAGFSDVCIKKNDKGWICVNAEK